MITLLILTTLLQTVFAANQLIDQNIEKCNSSSDLIRLLSKTKPNLYQCYTIIYKCETISDCDGTELLTVKWNTEEYSDGLFPDFLLTLAEKTTNPTKFLSLLLEDYLLWKEAFPTQMVSKIIDTLLRRALSLRDITAVKVWSFISHRLRSAKMENNHICDLLKYALNKNAVETIEFLSQFKFDKQSELVSELMEITKKVRTKDQIRIQCIQLMDIALKNQKPMLALHVFAYLESFVDMDYECLELQMQVYKTLESLIQPTKSSMSITNINARRRDAFEPILSETAKLLIAYSHSNRSSTHQRRKMAEFDILQSIILYRNDTSNPKKKIMNVISKWNHVLLLHHLDGMQVIYYHDFDPIVLPYLLQHLFYYRTNELYMDLILNTDSENGFAAIFNTLQSWDSPVTAYVHSYLTNAVYVKYKDILATKQHLLNYLESPI